MKAFLKYLKGFTQKKVLHNFYVSTEGRAEANVYILWGHVLDSRWGRKVAIWGRLSGEGSGLLMCE